MTLILSIYGPCAYVHIVLSGFLSSNGVIALILLNLTYIFRSQPLLISGLH